MIGDLNPRDLTSMNNPSVVLMRERTMQLINQEQAVSAPPLSPESYNSQPLSPESYSACSATSPGSPMSYNGGMPGLLPDQYSSPIRTSADATTQVPGLPGAARSTFAHNQRMDVAMPDMMQTPTSLGQCHPGMPLSCNDLLNASANHAMNAPRAPLTPPHDDMFGLDVLDTDLMTLGPFDDNFLTDFPCSMGSIPPMPSDFKATTAAAGPWGGSCGPLTSSCAGLDSNTVYLNCNPQPSSACDLSPAAVVSQAQCIPQSYGNQQWSFQPTPGSRCFPMPAMPASHRGKTDLPIVALWEFLLEALFYQCYEHILKWKNKDEGEFKIVNSSALAKLWGVYKRKKDMNFDKMSRAMRYYYDKGILEKGSSGARLEYKFGPRSKWLEFRPPHGSTSGRFFLTQAPRRPRGSKGSVSSNAVPKTVEEKATPGSETSPATVAVTTPLSHPPLPPAHYVQDHMPVMHDRMVYDQFTFPKKVACPIPNLRFAPY